MAFRKLKSFLLAGLLLAAGCSSAPTAEETNPVHVLVPSGAPALAMTLAMDGDSADVLDYADGTDLLTAELSKTDGEYDVIVAPVNLGLKTWQANDTYQMAGVLSWGNLYLVGRDEADLQDADKTIALFGDQAVPGMVYQAVADQNVQAEPEWYASVADAQQALLAGKADAAMLAEPAATAARAKDDSLKVLADLQTLWQEQEQTDSKGYPQAAVFVKESVSDEWLDALSSSLEAIDPADEEGKLAEIIEAAGTDKIGVPNAAIALKSWNGQNIRYVPAADARADLEAFLQRLGMELPEGALR